MLENEDLQEPEHHDEKHDLWLAMQSAYLEYRQASYALECTRGTTEELSAAERVSLMILEGRQRVTFERYLEARMGFLEFHCDQFRRPDGAFYDSNGAHALAGRADEARGRFLPAGFRPVLEIIAVALLCTTSFSLVREQKHVRGLEASRDELRATLQQTREGLQILGKRLEAVDESQRSPIQRANNTATQAVPRATSQPAIRKPSVGKQAKHQPALLKHTLASSASTLATQKVAAPKSYRFTLTPSPKFTRLGPVEVLVWSVDQRRKTASLSILAGSVALNLPSLKPNQPVSINRGHQQPRLEFLVDRIDGNRLDGRLVEQARDKPELRASRGKSELQSTF